MLQHLKHIHLVSIFQNISLFNMIIIFLKHKTVVVGTLKMFLCPFKFVQPTIWDLKGFLNFIGIICKLYRKWFTMDCDLCH